MHAECRERTSLAVLADLVGGCVCGDPSTSVSGVAPLDAAGPDQISFLTNPKYQDKILSTQAAAIIAHPSVKGTIDKDLLIVENPYLAFAKVLTFFEVTEHKGAGVLPGACVHPDAKVAENVTISPGCVVAAGAQIGKSSFLAANVVVGENTVIGEDCILHANVTVREKCILGDRVIIQPGAVIGSDGFGFAPNGHAYFKIPQVGYVIIEDDAEIGACTCIDRGTLGATRVGRGAKIDNLVQVGHNVEVGEDTILVSQVGISGSTVIGKHCTFGGQSGAAGHIAIGDNVTVAARGGITNDVEGNQMLAGLPAIPHKEWLKMAMTMTHLPEMRRELRQLKKQMEELQEKLPKEDK
jgi:UDP-3-O-[3-hydroxymyristoyl] glucosamine N-acyltransferase